VGPAPRRNGSVVNLSWKKPIGDVVRYRVYRVDGPTKKVLVAQVTSVPPSPLPATTAVDDKVTRGKTYTYFATARSVDNSETPSTFNESGMSNFGTVTIP
jgi:hypothetical protein